MGIEKGKYFKPTDQDLMKWLLNEVTGSGFLDWRCGDDLIGKEDLYGSKEPWEVFGRDRKEKERLFFTELKRVGKNKDGRICRNVGNGYWSNKGQKVWIRGHGGGLIGYKRDFRYERKKGKGGQMNSSSSDCDWHLKEYLFTLKSGVKEEYANYALCVLRRREKKKGSDSGGGPTEDEISAAAHVEGNVDWLRQVVGLDGPVDYDDAPGDDDRAVPPIDDCGMQEVDEPCRSMDHPLLLIGEEESLIPTAPVEESGQIDDDCSMQEEVDGWIVEDRRPLFGEEECSGRATVDDDDDRVQLLDKSPNLTVDDDRDRVLIGEESSSQIAPVGDDDDDRAQLLDRSPVIESSIPLDEWLDGDVEEEFSILAAAAKGPPCRDLDFDFGDYRCDQFAAAWDVFCDPWAVATQQMQMLIMPPVV